MLFPLFVAVPGEQVTICLKNQNVDGEVLYASAMDTTGNGAKNRYIINVAGHDLEIDENQIQPRYENVKAK